MLDKTPSQVEIVEKSPVWVQGEILKQRLIDELNKKQRVTTISLYYAHGKAFSQLVIYSAVAKLSELGFGVKILNKPGDTNYSLEITRV